MYDSIQSVKTQTMFVSNTFVSNQHKFYFDSRLINITTKYGFLG